MPTVRSWSSLKCIFESVSLTKSSNEIACNVMHLFYQSILLMYRLWWSISSLFYFVRFFIRRLVFFQHALRPVFELLNSTLVQRSWRRLAGEQRYLLATFARPYHMFPYFAFHRDSTGPCRVMALSPNGVACAYHNGKGCVLLNLTCFRIFFIQIITWHHCIMKQLH